MKATGIVRRIDDLGRVVIPKEIRRTMRIREGDPLEIYTDKDGGVIFKKYSLMGGLVDFAGQLHCGGGRPPAGAGGQKCFAPNGAADGGAAGLSVQAGGRAHPSVCRQR